MRKVCQAYSLLALSPRSSVPTEFSSLLSHGDVNILGMLSCIAANRTLGKALPKRSRSPHLSTPTKQLHKYFVMSNSFLGGSTKHVCLHLARVFFHSASFLLLIASNRMYVPVVPACVRGVAARKRNTKLVCTIMATAVI